MIEQTQLNLMGEALHLATLLVDQVEYVDVLDEVKTAAYENLVREDGEFSRLATAFVRAHRQREKLKVIVDRMAKRTAASELHMRMVPPHEVEAACWLISAAVKGLLTAENPRARLRRRRLILKFESIEAPWYQDRHGSALVT